MVPPNDAFEGVGDAMLEVALGSAISVAVPVRRDKGVGVKDAIKKVSVDFS